MISLRQNAIQMKKKFLIIAILVIVLIAICWGWKLFHQGRTSMSSIKPVAKISAVDLYNAFENNENSANHLYLGKAIIVSGKVLSLRKSDNQAELVLNAGNDKMGGINCSLKAKDLLSVKIGDSLNVQGLCTGFLMDVNLVDAIVVSK